MQLSCQCQGVGASAYLSGIPVRRYGRRVLPLVLVSVVAPFPPRRFARAVPASAPGCRPAAPQCPTPGIQPRKPPALRRLTSRPAPLVGVKFANTDTPARPLSCSFSLHTFPLCKNTTETPPPPDKWFIL